LPAPAATKAAIVLQPQQLPGDPAATAGSRPAYTTPNTVRAWGPNVYAAATAVTQLTYGATHHEDRPHAVTLVRADRPADAMLAASRITHFPVNSPVLYVDADRLPPETLAELRRLGPDGNTYDRKVQVYLVGPISQRVERDRAQRIVDVVAEREPGQGVPPVSALKGTDRGQHRVDVQVVGQREVQFRGFLRAALGELVEPLAGLPVLVLVTLPVSGSRGT
jgi:hypothetical protein